jgi:hypothetical protein
MRLLPCTVLLLLLVMVKVRVLDAVVANVGDLDCDDVSDNVTDAVNVACADTSVDLLVSDAVPADPDTVRLRDVVSTRLGTTASPLRTATRVPASISARTLATTLLLLMAMPDTTDVVTPDEFA